MVQKENDLTLDDVLLQVITMGLRILPEKEKDYCSFLERQLAAHPEYDLNFRNRHSGYRSQPFYFNLLVDEVLLYARLQRDQPVKTDLFDGRKETLIDTFDKLPLLRSRGNAWGAWPDNSLCQIYLRRYTAHQRHPVPDYREILKECGKDPLIVALWGRELDYGRDMNNQRKKGLPADKGW